MKILLVGSFQKWMGLHLRHFSAAFTAAGHQVQNADYTLMRTLFGGCFGTRLRIHALEQELLDRRLERMVKTFHPDLIFFVASWKFDLARLREYYSGLTAIYDYDGPRRLSIQDFLDTGPVDLLLTVSRYLERELTKRGRRCFYLPHGTDTDYYAPETLSSADLQQFRASVSYIGRATPRRAELCSALADSDLALYGARWRNYPALADANRLQRDVAGRELVKIYCASDATLNILQEPLDRYRTILSLQCFAVPASGGCLIAERVEEFPEAFEDGREALAFDRAEELQALVERIRRDPAAARRIGEAGRKRCLAAAENTELNTPGIILPAGRRRPASNAVDGPLRAYPLDGVVALMQPGKRLFRRISSPAGSGA